MQKLGYIPRFKSTYLTFIEIKSRRLTVVQNQRYNFYSMVGVQKQYQGLRTIHC